MRVRLMRAYVPRAHLTATRYLVSDACVLERRPLVSGAAVATDGQVPRHMMSSVCVLVCLCVCVCLYVLVCALVYFCERWYAGFVFTCACLRVCSCICLIMCARTRLRACVHHLITTQAPTSGAARASSPSTTTAAARATGPSTPCVAPARVTNWHA